MSPNTPQPNGDDLNCKNETTIQLTLHELKYLLVVYEKSVNCPCILRDIIEQMVVHNVQIMNSDKEHRNYYLRGILPYQY